MPSKKNKPVSISSLANTQSEILKALFARTAQITALQQKIQNELDPPLREHLFVADFDSSALTLYTDSPAWAAKLRYNIPVITRIAQVSCGLTELRSVRIKVVLPETDTTSTKRKIKLSDQTKQLIRETIESTKDPQLRSALLRLSSD